jgi:hypothetical protein
MTLHSGWLSPDGQTRQGTRLTALGATTPAGPVSSRSGVLPGHDDSQYRVGGFWVGGIAGGMTATVGPGRAVIQGSALQGAYPVALDADITLTFPDGDAQYDRIDVVVLRVYDDAFDGSGRSEAAVEIVPGTPAATPAVPTLPALTLPLANVTVRAGAGAGTGGIAWDTDKADVRTTLVSAGGILPVYNNAALPGGYAGQYRDSASGTLERWNGTAWLPAVTQQWSHVQSFDDGYTTSTSYTPTLTGRTLATLAFTFTAPSSGAAILHFGARMMTEGSITTTAYMAPQVSQGGTVVLNALDDYAACHGGGSLYSSVSSVIRFTFTAGLSYTFTAMHRSSSSTVNCWFDNLFMRLDPA